MRARRALVLLVVAGGALLEWDRRAWARSLADLDGAELGRVGVSAVRAGGRARARLVGAVDPPVVEGYSLQRGQ